MKQSKEGRAFLIKEEGSRTKAYKDSKGVWTIGVGHTAAAGPPAPKAGMVISKEEVDELLSKDIVKYESIVDRHIKVSLNQNEYDALVSLVFNIGEGNFSQSTVKRLLNLGDRKGAADAFLLWKRSGNDPDILLPRRKRERELFLKKVNENVGIYPSNPGPDRPIPERAEASGNDEQAPRSGTTDGPSTTGSEQSGGGERQPVRFWVEALRRLGLWFRSGV